MSEAQQWQGDRQGWRQAGRQGSLEPLAGVSLPWETPCWGFNILLLQIGSPISASFSRPLGLVSQQGPPLCWWQEAGGSWGVAPADLTRVCLLKTEQNCG